MNNALVRGGLVAAVMLFGAHANAAQLSADGEGRLDGNGSRELTSDLGDSALAPTPFGFFLRDSNDGSDSGEISDSVNGSFANGGIFFLSFASDELRIKTNPRGDGYAVPEPGTLGLLGAGLLGLGLSRRRGRDPLRTR